VNTGTPARYIAMAMPLLTECNPIWLVENPRLSGPNIFAARHSRFSNCVPVKSNFVPSSNMYVFTVVSGLDDL
jgi:hypothetical protein